MKNTALITGSSSGIGRELAILFARDGYDLVLVARDKAKLDSLAQELEQQGTHCDVIVQDLANPAGPQAIVDHLERESILVDVLVNNAGTQVYGEFAEADLQALLTLIQVNVMALTHLTRLLLPGMLARGQGKILNVGSTGSFVPGPLNAVYCATKAYVLSLSEAIAAEVVGTGVTVTSLCPGATETAFVTRYGLEDVRLFDNMMSATRVAEIGYRALMKGRRVVIAGAGNRLQVGLFQLLHPVMSTQMLARIGRSVMGRTGG